MQEPIELILVKHWASYVAVPIFIVDVDGNLVFFNESAEEMLGRSFDEAGQINAADLDELFVTQDLDGNPIPAEQLPLMRSLTEHTPAHASVCFEAFDGSWRQIDATAIPIIGQGSRFVGSMSIFWEIE